MIFLTKLDGTQVVVNDDLIVYAESTPDTVLTMTTGSRLMVKESLDVVVERAAEYQRRTQHQLEARNAIHAAEQNSAEPNPTED